MEKTRNLIVNDFKKMRFISNLKENSSSTFCIFNIFKMDYEKNKYIKKLYILNTKQNNLNRIKLYHNYENIQFYDDYNLIYNDKSTKIKNRIFTNFYIQGISKRKPKESFKIPLNISNFYILDNNKILILSQEEINSEKENVMEFERINFYDNDCGYNYNTIQRLYIYDKRSKKLQLISDKNINVEYVNVEKEHNIFFYIGYKVENVYKVFNNLYVFDYKNNSNKILYDKMDFEFSNAFKIKDKIIVTASNQKEYGINENHKFYELTNKNEMEIYCNNDNSFYNSINTDMKYNSSLSFKKYNNNIYFVSTREYSNNVFAHLYRLTDNKNIELISDLITSFDDFIISKERLIFIGSSKNTIGDLFSVKLNSSLPLLKNNYLNKIENLTNFSNRFKNKLDNYKIHRITFKSKKNIKDLEKTDFLGFVLYPKDYDENKKYPGILYVHGGPKTTFSDTFNYEFSLLSNEGYFVFFTNPVGSDNLTDEFADLRGKYGTIDYENLMDFKNTILEKIPAIDKSKLAIMGGSYGGFMVNHAIGKTKDFKTAITMRSISNFVSFYNTSDIGYFFAKSEANINNFKENTLWEMSPIKNAEKISTNLLILHSENDYRCPLSQGIEFFTRLKDLGKIKTKMVIFKGENHNLSRNGSVKSRIERLISITNWLKETLI